MLLFIRRRHQHIDIVANHFRAGVSEYLFSRRAKLLHNTAICNDDQAIGQVMNDVTQSCLGLLNCYARGFRPAPVPDKKRSQEKDK